MTGTPAADDYLPLLIEEFADEGQDPRAPDWRMDPKTKFSAVIVGAGMSGILAAIRMKQAGVPFVVIEKNADVGGTWYDNTYPGVRVDVPNAFYSYSFAQKPDWPKFFSEGTTLQQYFRACAVEFGVIDDIRFNTEVVDMTWNEDRATWSLRLRPSGRCKLRTTNYELRTTRDQRRRHSDRPAQPAEVPADQGHGVLRRTVVPLRALGPRRRPQGQARRRHRHRRVSAAQFVPVVAEQAAQLTIFQRTPNWFIPVPTYHDDVPQGLQWLFTRVPYYAHWNRFWMFWNSTEGMLPAATVDPNWPHQDRSVSEANEMIRVMLGMYMQGTMADRPDLVEKIMPKYPPAAKRIILENGSFFQALKRDNVSWSPTRSGDHSDAVITEPQPARRRRPTTPQQMTATPPTSSSTAPASRPPASSPRCRSPAATAPTSTSSGTARRAPTSASPSPTSRTSSCSTAPTPTSSSTAASSTSRSARCSTSWAA